MVKFRLKTYSIDDTDANLLAAGGLIGGIGGSVHGYYGKKAKGIQDRALKEGREYLKESEEIAKKSEALGRLLTDPDMKDHKEGIKKKLSENLKKAEENLAKTKKAWKDASRMVKKEARKGGWKGAGVGLAVAGGVVGGRKILKHRRLEGSQKKNM